MKALKIIAIIVVSLAAIIFITLQILPDEAHMSRSIDIEAKPSEIFREINTFKNFNKWSPWAAKDTATVYEFSGPDLGVGAKLAWTSESDQVGSGSMEIIEVNENSLVKTLMKFDGFDSSPTASYIIEQTETGSRLTWTYDETGVSGIGKIFASMMDKFLGPDYEQGLQNLKDRVESAPKSSTEISMVVTEAFDYLGITSTCELEMISSKMAQSYGALMEFMGRQGIEMSGAPIARYSSWLPDDIIFTCGIPVNIDISNLKDNIKKETIPGGLSIKSVYTGNYDGMETAHNEIIAYMEYSGYEYSDSPWEEYVTDPMEETDTSKWITNIYYPVK